MTLRTLHRTVSTCGLAALLALSGCASMAPDAAGATLRFSGTVQAIDTACYADGVCTATVDGIVVTTMTGERLGPPIWGQPNSLPAAGQTVDVHCLRTGPLTCTLKGSTDYFLRVRP